jgi:hypothetical protein
MHLIPSFSSGGISRYPQPRMIPVPNQRPNASITLHLMVVDKRADKRESRFDGRLAIERINGDLSDRRSIGFITHARKACEIEPFFSALLRDGQSVGDFTVVWQKPGGIHAWQDGIFVAR